MRWVEKVSSRCYAIEGRQENLPLRIGEGKGNGYPGFRGPRKMIILCHKHIIGNMVRYYRNRARRSYCSLGITGSKCEIPPGKPVQNAMNGVFCPKDD